MRMVKTNMLLSVVFLFVFFGISGTDLLWAKYPEKKIRFIVTFVPGGVTDVTARVLARYINPYLDNKVYVDNVAGAGGAIGWREGGKAAPDGYTLTVLSTALVVGPNVTKGFPTYELYDPICVVNLESRIILTKWDGRFKTFSDVASYAKKNPGELTGGTPGIGTLSHIGWAALDAVGVKITMVPYKGDGDSTIAAMGGHIDLTSVSSPAAKPYVDGNKLRPLAVMGKKRYAVYPNVPTLMELGYNVEIVAFSAIGVPKGTPQPIKETLAEAFRKATENEDYKKTMDQVGLEPVYLGPNEAGPWIKVISDRYKELSIKAGLKPE